MTTRSVPTFLKRKNAAQRERSRVPGVPGAIGLHELGGMRFSQAPRKPFGPGGRRTPPTAAREEHPQQPQSQQPEQEWR